MTQFGKDEVRKAISDKISSLCFRNNFKYTRETELTVSNKHFYLKEIKMPLVFLNKDSYPIGEKISFDGNGKFVFIDREESQQKSSIFKLTDYKFSGTAMSNTDCIGI